MASQLASVQKNIRAAVFQSELAATADRSRRKHAFPKRPSISNYPTARAPSLETNGVTRDLKVIDEFWNSACHRAASESDLLKTDHWRSICAVTFTLKQAYKSEVGHWQKPEQRAWTKNDPVQCQKTFRRFMRLLNKAVYGLAYKRHGKRLRIIPVLELGSNAYRLDKPRSRGHQACKPTPGVIQERLGRWHFHAAIEPPVHLSAEKFEDLIRQSWVETEWGYKKNDVDFDADRGWVDYILKSKQKAGFDTWSDAIDWEDLHNPIADD